MFPQHSQRWGNGEDYGNPHHLQAASHDSRYMYLSVLHGHLLEGPEENSAYEQLLSRLGEITEEGQFVGLAPTLDTLVIKNHPWEPQV